MCLPSILEIADQAGLTCNPRTLNRKEVMYKCPFCMGDSHVASKFKLSLNPMKNAFKCWLCGVSGGVLLFESKLLNIPYEDVKKKYFNKRNYHPAEMLSPIQLKMISWNEAKRQNSEHFKRSLDAVLLDWKEYEREQLVYTYAKFVIIAQMPKDRSEQLFAELGQACSDTGVKNLMSRVLDQYLLPNCEREEWVVEALELARGAWKVTLRTGDTVHTNTLANLVVLFHFSKMNKSKFKQQQVAY